MAQNFDETMSWSGEGVGTDKASFLRKVQDGVALELDEQEAAEAVFCALSRRLSGGTVARLIGQMPADVRQLFDACPKRLNEDAEATTRDDFYLDVAEHLLVDPEDVRRIISGVFGAIHSQITERESEKVASELPDDLSGTWIAARHDVPAPH